MIFRCLILLALGMICLAALFSSGCNKTASDALAAPAPAERKVKASVVAVEPMPIKDILVLPGQTKPISDLRLAADVGGLVESVAFREGDTVRQGEVIAKIDTAVLEASLANAKAAYELADQQYQRRKQLFVHKTVSRETLEIARTDREVAQGNLNQAKVKYEQGFVRSPVDGVINYLHVDPGEYVGAGAPVADVVDVSRIEIEANVPEMDVKYLAAGQPVQVRVDALPDMPVKGEITFVSFKADAVTRTFRVKVLVDNADSAIRPGMIARAVFLRRVVPTAVVAPLFAVVDKGGERIVFIEENGRARSRKVTLGIIDGDKVQVLTGLNPGDRLIVTGQTEVEDGVSLDLLGPQKS